jgi:radical SAM-linked protein
MIRFAIDGDLRYLSHRDCMRLFQRALVRADVPLRYSSGFNPRIRLQLPLPRPVGIAALDEVLVIETTEPVDPQSTLERLREQMPSGLTLHRAEPIAPGVKPRPVGAEYHLTVTNGLGAMLTESATNLLARERVDVRRDDPGQDQPKTLNIRPYIESIEMTGGALAMHVHLTQAGTVRPRELLEALELPADEHMNRLRRMRVTWDTPWTAPDTNHDQAEGASN